ncbi:MAG: YciI family protein [Fusobacteriaceae bacterium]|nr:YciI family protein [Fusobacteriaceae bacterium]
MFIINLTYIKPLEEVEKYLEPHVKYLKNQYASNNFIASGRKNPRTGGIIISKLEDIKILEKILGEDPFKINKIADYEIIEFIPTIVGKGYENLK